MGAPHQCSSVSTLGAVISLPWVLDAGLSLTELVCFALFPISALLPVLQCLSQNTRL